MINRQAVIDAVQANDPDSFEVCDAEGFILINADVIADRLIWLANEGVEYAITAVTELLESADDSIITQLINGER